MRLWNRSIPLKLVINNNIPVSLLRRWIRFFFYQYLPWTCSKYFSVVYRSHKSFLFLDTPHGSHSPEMLDMIIKRWLVARLHRAEHYYSTVPFFTRTNKSILLYAITGNKMCFTCNYFSINKNWYYQMYCTTQTYSYMYHLLSRFSQDNSRFSRESLHEC